MKKFFFIILLSIFTINCNTSQKNNCAQLLDNPDYTFVNGVAFYDTFNKNNYVKDESGRILQISRYIDPEKMEYVDWFVHKDMLRITKTENVKAGKITWDKKNKEIVIRDVNKNKPSKEGIEKTEKRIKYKIEKNVTYLSENGLKWYPVEVVVNSFFIPSIKNYKKHEMMTVGLYSDLFRCIYDIYATDEKTLKYKTWDNWYGVVIIDGEERYLRSPQGNAQMMMSSDYIERQKEEIIKAKHVYITLVELWETKGIITVSDGYKNKKGYGDYIPSTEKKYKYVIKDDKGYVLTWDEKDCDELKIKIIEKNDTSLKANRGKPEIKFSLSCKWFQGVYEIRDVDEGEH